MPIALAWFVNTAFAAMDRWAIARCPSGTRVWRSRGGLMTWIIGWFDRAVLSDAGPCTLIYWLQT